MRMYALRFFIVIGIFSYPTRGQSADSQTFFDENDRACCCIGKQRCGIEGRNLMNTRTLLADILGIHPTGREGCYEIEHCPAKNTNLFAIDENPNSNETDNDYSFEDFYGDGDGEDFSLRIAHDFAFETEPTPKTCPDGYMQCCYESQEELLDTAGALCGNEVEDWFPACEENVKDSRFKQCGERPGFKPLPNLRPDETSPEEFPWTCIIMDLSNRRVGHCVIIPNSVNNDIAEPTFQVLTVAHKVEAYQSRPNQLKVRVLEYDLSGFVPEEKQPEREFLVSSVRVHIGFNQTRLLSDNIAVLQLQEPIDLRSNPGINAACIPSCEGMFDYQFKNETGTRCWVVGWGESRPKGNPSSISRNTNQGGSRILRKVDVPIMPEKDLCQRRINEAIFKQQGQRFNIKILDEEICAGGEKGKDSCTGDGGAPLVCQAGPGGRWYVVGLVGWGIGCGEEGVPGIYTRVAHYITWLSGR